MLNLGALLYLPLDNRQTTMGLFMNYAEWAAVPLKVLPADRMGAGKVRTPRRDIRLLGEQDIANVDADLISVEMLVYEPKPSGHTPFQPGVGFHNDIEGAKCIVACAAGWESIPTRQPVKVLSEF